MSDKVATIKPSASLAAAAMAGLLGMGASACGKLPLSKDKKDDQAATTATATTSADPKVTSKKNVPDMTFALFAEQCKGRSGLVETHAACGGAGSCKGMSFNKYSKDLIEHTCKGGNTCAGMSCIDTPADTNLTAEALYQKACSGCHAGMTGEQADSTKFKVFYPKGGDATKAVADFSNRSELTHVSIVAFGTQGTNPSGYEYSNMPAYYSKYSRAEIERVVTYVRTLTPTAEEYQILSEP
jgi:mono/diheme cytochrome c family protein